MKRLVLSAVLVFCFASPSFVFAQALRGDHVEVGAFVDYFHLDRTKPSLNYAGLGGRLAFNLRPSVQLETEMSYDFDRTYKNPFDDRTIARSQTHILHGLFGPKFQTGSGPFLFFVAGEAGVLKFNNHAQNAPTG